MKELVMKKHFKISILILLLSFISENIIAQCMVTAAASDDTIFKNDVLFLVATGQCDTFFLRNNFDSGQIGSAWNSFPAPLFTNPCDTVYPGTYIWMGSNPGNPRSITSSQFFLNSGNEICFKMKYASQSLVDCEPPDGPDEGVHLQYSTSSGSSWIDISYWTPDVSIPDSIYGWNNYCEVIPAAAFGTNVMFRWFQDFSSAATHDHWGIDEVEIKGVFPGNISWSHGPTVFNPPAVFPTHDTTFIVTLTGDGHTSIDSVSVVVIDPNQINDIDIIKSKIKVFPNPAGENTFIEYELRGNSNVNISVYDILGKKIATIYYKNQRKGNHKIPLNTANLSKGIYIVNIEIIEGDNIIIKPILLQKQ